MKLLIVLCISLATTCSTLDIPMQKNALLKHSRNTFLGEFFELMALLENVILSIQKVAKEVSITISSFNTELLNEMESFSKMLTSGFDNLQKQVGVGVEKGSMFMEGFSLVVAECMHVDENIFNNTTNPLTCADEGLNEVNEKIQPLRFLAIDAISEGKAAIESVKKCNPENFLKMALCLAQIITYVQDKSVTLFTKSADMVANIEQLISNLPKTFEVCVAHRVPQDRTAVSKAIAHVANCVSTSTSPPN